jgi:hypothetical protein
VHEGAAVFSPGLAGFVLDAFAGQTAPAIKPGLDQLTPREQQGHDKTYRLDSVRARGFLDDFVSVPQAGSTISVSAGRRG